ncbi:MAG: phage tail sheath subtilisin-like domain-containing protein, partial [Chloroflexi bacterium]|nr:phage tail sheath subtilisin-like domain-containing protein [Chloroflexota bacterium]
MPEYLAPGVYIEEVSFRAKTIEGVSTSTAGFVGPARYGPIRGEPELLTSFADFERIYGGLDPLDFDGETTTNFLAHAVRAFFEEGGRRLYVARVYNGDGGEASADNSALDDPALPLVTLEGRFPGAAGNLRVTFVPRLSDNLLLEDGDGSVVVKRIQEHDTVVRITDLDPLAFTLCDIVRSGDTFTLQPAAGAAVAVADLDPDTEQVRMLSVDVLIERPVIRPRRPREKFGPPDFISGFAFHPANARALTAYFAAEPPTRQLSLSVPFAVLPDAALNTGAELAPALLGSAVVENLINKQVLEDPDVRVEDCQTIYRLSDGSDGDRPGDSDYRGEEVNNLKSGLLAMEDIEQISIIAAPGFSFDYGDNTASVNAVMAALISHCERMRYRIAVLDAPDHQSVSQALAFRSRVDSTHAALYYPWITVMDPITEAELNLPPSGFTAGIYARNDVERGVHKAPANEVARMAIGLEFLLNKSQQDVLNPEGVNCYRFFEGRGFRLWGARTVSSDPEWKYVNLRRYFAFLERSIEKGTQWAVFEPNGDALWANVRR